MLPSILEFAAELLFVVCELRTWAKLNCAPKHNCLVQLQVMIQQIRCNVPRVRPVGLDPRALRLDTGLLLSFVSRLGAKPQYIRCVQTHWHPRFVEFSDARDISFHV